MRMQYGGHADTGVGARRDNCDDDEALLCFVERYLRVELPGADERQIQAAAEEFIAGLGDE